MELEPVAVEVVKVVTAELTGVAVKGGQRLVRLLRRKLGSVPTDSGELTRQVVAAAAADPDWWTSVTSEVAALNGPLPTTHLAAPPVPFFDRVRPLAEAPYAGVFVIAGQRGSGRTALARQLAQVRGEEFPLGVVQIDLDDHRVEGTLQFQRVHEEVLGWLGIDDVATAERELLQQYVSATVTRRFVLILCNARGADEVRPFVTTPVNLVLVTTQNLTNELRADYPFVQLGPLDRDDAWAMLASACGAVPLAAEPDAAWQLLDLCGFLPFAIQHVGTALSRRAGEVAPVAGLLADLRDSGLVGPVQAVLAETCDALTPDQQRAAELLAWHPAPGFTVQSARALLGDSARELIEDLDDAGLLVGPVRYRLHGPVHDYVARQTDGAEAFESMLTYWRDVAVAADQGERLRRYPEVHRRQLTGALLDWLDQERLVLLDLARTAHARGRHEEVCQLAGALEVLVNERAGWHWYAALNELAISSASQLAVDDTTRARACLARAHAMQGRAYTQLQVFDRAAAELDRARRLVATMPDDRQLRSSVLEFLGRLHQEQGDLHQAAAYLTEAVALDEETGDGRALGIHARMRANVLLDARVLDQVDRLLARAAAATDDDRNQMRVEMVWIRADLAAGRLDDAAARLDLAHARASTADWTSYQEELKERDAELAWARGDRVATVQLMGDLVRHAFFTGHPKAYRYLSKLDWFRSQR